MSRAKRSDPASSQRTCPHVGANKGVIPHVMLTKQRREEEREAICEADPLEILYDNEI